MKIERMPISYFEDFDIIISAVDSLAIRFWLSSTLNMIDNSRFPVFIDCGTEGIFIIRVFIGFYGHIFSTRIRKGPCLECISNLYAFRPTDTINCTINASHVTVRNLIMWGLYIAWDQGTSFGESTEFSIANQEHVDWVIKQCMAKSKLFSESELRSELYSFQILSPSPISITSTIGGMVVLHLMNILNKTQNMAMFTFLSLRDTLHMHSFSPETSSLCTYCT